MDGNTYQLVSLDELARELESPHPEKSSTATGARSHSATPAPAGVVGQVPRDNGHSEASGQTPSTPRGATEPADAQSPTTTVASTDQHRFRAPVQQRFDRAGQLRPANKRFLQRDMNGKLLAPVPGAEDQTQLQEIQEWVKDKNHMKFQLIPGASHWTFEDIDPIVLTEPLNLRNQGRKLLIGKDGATEIWAVLPVHHKKVYMCRILKRDGPNDAFKGIIGWNEMNDSITELDYPFQAFKLAGDANAWTQFQAVIGYIFLMCGEASIVFSDSSKWPTILSCALTRIQNVYSPHDPLATAEMVMKSLETNPIGAEAGGGESSSADAGKPSQLEIINQWLEDKKISEYVQAMVWDTSFFKFEDFNPNTLSAKGIINAHNRVLFLGEDDDVEAWAAIARTPNKATLGWIFNRDKTTGTQTPAHFWPNVPDLNFPFQAFKIKGDETSWRRMTYMIGYIFLVCGEAEAALNIGESFFKNFYPIHKMVKEHYGSCFPPNDSEDAEEQVELAENDQASKQGGQSSRTISQASSIEGQESSTKSAGGAHTIAPLNEGASRSRSTEAQHRLITSARKPLSQLSGANTQLKARKSASKRPRGITMSTPGLGNINVDPADDTWVDAHGDFTDHKVSAFLASTNTNGKRPANDDKENVVAQFKRVKAEREEVEALQQAQMGVLGTIQRKLETEKMKLVRLKEADQRLFNRMGQLVTELKDEDLAQLE